MKILVTGHKGFVGSYLTARLDKEKIEWVGFDLKDGLDIRNAYQVYEFFDMHRPDTVIHLAALAGVRRGEEFPQEYFDTNVMGTWNIVRTAEKFEVQKFVNFSSSSVYGNKKPPVIEGESKEPKSIYGKTKLIAEQIVDRSSIFLPINIRPFTIYGLGGRKDMVIYRWLGQIKRNEAISFYGDGESKRGYVHVEDLIDGVVLCLKSKNFTTKIGTGYSFNLGGQEVISLEDLSEIFFEIIPDMKIFKLPMPPSDIYENWADITKAQEELGWQPKRKFKDEVKKIIKNEL